jgi:hypothetical protein
VPVRTFARASWVAKSAPTITTITVSKMYRRFIRLPPLVYVELVLLVFFRTYQQTVVLGLYPSTMVGRSPNLTAETIEHLRVLAQPQRTSENSVAANFYEKALFVKPTWRPLCG